MTYASPWAGKTWGVHKLVPCSVFQEWLKAFVWHVRIPQDTNTTKQSGCASCAQQIISARWKMAHSAPERAQGPTDVLTHTDQRTVVASLSRRSCCRACQLSWSLKHNSSGTAPSPVSRHGGSLRWLKHLELLRRFITFGSFPHVSSVCCSHLHGCVLPWRDWLPGADKT